MSMLTAFAAAKPRRAVVERHVGTERIKQEALESLMPKAIAEDKENILDVITRLTLQNLILP